MKIRHIYISPGHNFYGHHEKPPGENPEVEVDQVECVAGKGLAGDRFFGYKEDYKGQLTLFSWEVYLEACEAFHIDPDETPPSVFRRNIIVEGMDLNALIGKEFELQGVTLSGSEEASPCYWMNQAFADGAHDWLKGRGGLRARILTDGVLRTENAVDPAVA
ncbi:MAG: MOSC domain-containing protein [Verrucomicrobiota bacterium]